MEEICIRTAKLEDAKRLVEIYTPYVEETAITFEYDVPMLFMLVQPTIGPWRPVSMSKGKRESLVWVEHSIRPLKKFARKWGF